MKINKTKGFTLIELLTSLSIAVVIVAAVASLLASAFHVIQILDSRKKAVLENSLIALEKIAKELQESPVCPPIPLQGNKHEISFPKIYSSTGKDVLNTEFRLGQVQKLNLGKNFEFKKVRYFYDASKEALLREVEDEEPVVVADHLKDVEFSYALISIQDGRTSWKGATPSAETPEKLGAFSVHVEFNKDIRYTIPGIEKTFFLFRAHPLNAIMPAEET